MLKGHGDDGYAQQTAIKHDFSSNVCKEALPEGLLEYLCQHFEALTHYPEPASESLRTLIARREGVNPASVLVTNGATEAIYLTAQAFPRGVSYVLQPTFSEYADASRLSGHQVKGIRHLEEVGEEATMVWLCNPNNPTGTVIPKGELLLRIAAHPDVVFVVDQSYEAFCREPMLSVQEAATYGNLLLLHSMTKQYALPGLRLGYLTGAEKLVGKVECRLKAQEAEYAETRSDFFAELDSISLKSITDKGLQKRVKTLIGEIKASESREEDEEQNEENIWDITSNLDELTESWLPDIFGDSLRYVSWDEKSAPQYYLPDWLPDVFDCFLGQDAKPTLEDKMEISKCFENSENFNEKVAWGFITLGVERLAPCEGILKMCEEIFASGNYSPLLDILWRAYREKYNGTYSCPSTYCYSPNLRYNHFRRMIAYTTLLHIEAHPEDELARVQYYFMVMHTNILRFNHPYPFGNSAATEYMLLYWNQMLLYY